MWAISDIASSQGKLKLALKPKQCEQQLHVESRARNGGFSTEVVAALACCEVGKVTKEQ